jgi:molecular chaperone GrpE
MVKKKSHEERHEDHLPEENTLENGVNANEEASLPEPGPEEQMTAETEEKETAVQTSGEDELNKKLTEIQDKYLRLSAEFDNYRKRTLREKMELAKSGGESVILGLLPVVDDFDRAMASMRDTENCGAVKEGLVLIYNKLSDFLKQNGVSEISALNEPFNADHHEAITGTAVEDDSLKGRIIEVIQKGYSLHGKTIRFPKVIVGE